MLKYVLWNGNDANSQISIWLCRQKESNIIYIYWNCTQWALRLLNVSKTCGFPHPRLRRQAFLFHLRCRSKLKCTGKNHRNYASFEKRFFSVVMVVVSMFEIPQERRVRVNVFLSVVLGYCMYTVKSVSPSQNDKPRIHWLRSRSKWHFSPCRTYRCSFYLSASFGPLLCKRVLGCHLIIR